MAAGWLRAAVHVDATLEQCGLTSGKLAVVAADFLVSKSLVALDEIPAGIVTQTGNGAAVIVLTIETIDVGTFAWSNSLIVCSDTKQISNSGNIITLLHSTMFCRLPVI